MQDDYKSLSRSLDRHHRQPTPELGAAAATTAGGGHNTRPPSRNSLTGSGSIRRIDNNNSNNSLAHIPFPSMDHSPYKAEPGEFDPYKPEAVTKVYSNDYAEASEYQKYLTASRNI